MGSGESIRVSAGDWEFRPLRRPTRHPPESPGPFRPATCSTGMLDNRQCEKRSAAHGVDVGQRIGGCDAAEIERVIDDGHEKVRGRDNGLPIVDLEDRGIVGGLRSHQEMFELARRHLGQDLREHRGRELASASTAMREIRQASE